MEASRAVTPLLALHNLEIKDNIAQGTLFPTGFKRLAPCGQKDVISQTTVKIDCVRV